MHLFIEIELYFIYCVFLRNILSRKKKQLEIVNFFERQKNFNKNHLLFFVLQHLFLYVNHEFFLFHAVVTIRTHELFVNT